MGRLERTSAQHPRAMDALEAQAGLRGVQTFMPPRAAGWQAKSRGGAACCQLPPGAWPGALSTSPCPRGHHLLGLGHASPLCPVGGRLLSQAVAGALSSCCAGFLPHPLLLLSLLCSGSPQGRGPAAAGRAAVRSTRPVFSGDAPAFKAAAAFPRPAQVLRDPVLTTIPGR